LSLSVVVTQWSLVGGSVVWWCTHEIIIFTRNRATWQLVARGFKLVRGRYIHTLKWSQLLLQTANAL